ncbi:MAG TPA: hypothetical protein VJQ56_13195 [Blastocatellia bacterium]|nr:hypothetical protein [Blastocatellia bacterium]
MADRKHANHPDETPDVSHIQNADVRHEHTDVPIKPIAGFLAGLLIATVIVYFLMYLLFNTLEKQAARQEAAQPRSPLASERQSDPPEPRLQLIPSHPVHPLDELVEMKREEDQSLSNYGWVDQPTGSVRIPIERAKEIAVGRGLGARPQGQPPAQGGAQSMEQEVPTDASSGRMMERRRQ